MKEYAKIVLYAYPFLKTVEKDYEEHVKNKALLSYRGNRTAEELAEYLAEEILHARNLVWLREAVKRVLARLSEEERAMTDVRYFGKKGAFKGYLERLGKTELSGSKYVRKQKNLGEKLEAALLREGVDEEVYESLFSSLSLFKKLESYAEREREKKISAEARR